MHWMFELRQQEQENIKIQLDNQNNYALLRDGQQQKLCAMDGIKSWTKDHRHQFFDITVILMQQLLLYRIVDVDYLVILMRVASFLPVTDRFTQLPGVGFSSHNIYVLCNQYTTGRTLLPVLVSYHTGESNKQIKQEKNKSFVSG